MKTFMQNQSKSLLNKLKCLKKIIIFNNHRDIIFYFLAEHVFTEPSTPFQILPKYKNFQQCCKSPIMLMGLNHDKVCSVDTIIACLKIYNALER